ncbi:MAG: hypothetical protein KatS3mg129_0748 [Leptospiraceae bacterium]|nr:MAG: hypothetical protein KatS3mg129_0748 [Leptospiraceae bacterium]
MNVIFWVLLGFILSLLEIFIPGMIIIFFGISSFIMAILVYFGFISNLIYQFFYWSIISILLVLLLRRFVIKYFPSLEKNEFSKDSLEGQKGIVIEEVNPYTGKGRVKVSGTYWKAISSLGTIIPVGKEIIVEKQDGLLLYVRVHN